MEIHLIIATSKFFQSANIASYASAEERLTLRHQQSAPWVEDFELWLIEQHVHVPKKFLLDEALGYIARQKKIGQIVRLFVVDWRRYRGELKTVSVDNTYSGNLGQPKTIFKPPGKNEGEHLK